MKFEIEELACLACGKTEKETEDIINNYEVEDLLYERYEVSEENYEKIVEDLINFTPLIESAISDKKYRAFVIKGRMIYRKEV